MSCAAPGAQLLALVGPTAAGKTELSLLIAERLDAEIVSADSMLLYRGMDIGTAKPTLEQRRRVPHHLIDVAEPSETFSVAAYQRLAAEAIEDIVARGRRSLVVGGSGLYYRAVVDRLEFPGTDAGTRLALETEAIAGQDRLYERLEDLDPVAAAKIEPGNVRRTVRALEVAAVTGRPFSTFSAAWETYPAHGVRVAGLEISREILNERIGLRVAEMIRAGFAGEVKDLIAAGFGDWITASQAIGYAEVARQLEGEITPEEAVRLTVKRTRALARRQLAWFRRDPRITWFASNAGESSGTGDAGDAGLERLAEKVTEYLIDGR